jgi:aspartate-semialdehyde dehydrogenase
VFSNASDNRRKDGIPLVITEVNASHFDMLDGRKTEGLVVTNGNCSGIVLTLALAPLHRAFGIKGVHVVTLQALSGAGYPGVPSLSILDNLVPYIGGEESKVEAEPLHVLGTANKDGTVSPETFPISATCTRVPVIEGHSMAVHVALEGDPALEDVRRAIEEQHGLERLDLPTAPARALRYDPRDDRPQPRKDRDNDNGMSVTVGRLRDDPLLTAKFFVSGSNTIRGAAGQSILNAEYLVNKGTI